MLISIIVPCYNVAAFLDKSLNGIYNQTYSNWECILINDGSIDNTKEILESWENKDSRFKVINQENKGVSIARNNGLKIATGDFIYFFDADDLLPTNSLIDLTNLVTDDIDIVIGKSAVTDGQNTNTKHYLNHYSITRQPIYNDAEKELVKIAMINDIICVAWNKLYRKSFLHDHKLKFLENVYHEDELWFFETLFHARAITFNEVETYYYNVSNTASITNKFTLVNLESYLKILGALHKKYVIDSNNKLSKEIASNYIEHLKIKVLVHCYKQLSKKDKKRGDSKIISTFKSLRPSYINTEILPKSYTDYFKQLHEVRSLKPKYQMKFMKYYNSKRTDRRLKKIAFKLLSKIKSY